MKKVTGAKVTGAVVALTMCLNSVPSTALAENESPLGGDIKAVSEAEERTEEIVPEESTPTEEVKVDETEKVDVEGQEEGTSEGDTQEEESKEELNQPREEEKQPAQEAVTLTAESGIAVQAADEAVAKIGDTEYETLDEAIEATFGEDSATISLLKNAVLSSEAYAYCPLVIEMNGFSITGDITAGDDLTLNNGTVEGNVTVDANSVNGKFVMTAPANAEAAITGNLTVNDGCSANISGANIGVKGTLYISTEDDNITILGTDKAVELTEEPTLSPASIIIYGSTTLDGDVSQAEFKTDSYYIGEEVAKKITNVAGGSVTPPVNSTISFAADSESKDVVAGNSVTFTVKYDGTKDLDAYVQKNGLVDITATIENSGENTYTVTVTPNEDVAAGKYTVFVHEKDDSTVNAKATLNITEAGAKLTIGDTTTYYATLAEILANKLTGGSTITLLKDEKGSADVGTMYINTEEAGIMLNLNGKSLGYTSLYVGNIPGDSGKSGKVTVISDEGTNHLTIDVGTNGTLIFAPKSAGTTGYISSCGGDITLSGGHVTIGNINGTNKPIANFLARGYAYKDDKANEWVTYAKAAATTYVNDRTYSVVQCDHNDIVTDDTGKINCKYCNETLDISVEWKSIDGTTKYFKDLATALADSDVTSSNADTRGTLKILSSNTNANELSISAGNFDLDLNGTTMTGRFEIYGGSVNIKNTNLKEATVSYITVDSRGVTLGENIKYGTVETSLTMKDLLTDGMAVKEWGTNTYLTEEDLNGHMFSNISVVKAPLYIMNEPIQDNLDSIVYGTAESGLLTFVFSESGVTVKYKIDNGDEVSKGVLSDKNIDLTTETALWNLSADEHTFVLSVTYDGYTINKTYTFTVSQSEANIVITSAPTAVTYFDQIYVDGRVETTGTAATSTNTNNISTYSGDDTLTSNYVELYDNGGKTYGKFAVNNNGNFRISLPASDLGIGELEFGVKYTGNENMADTQTAHNAIKIQIVKLIPNVTSSGWRGYPYGKTYDGTAVKKPSEGNGLEIKYSNDINSNIITDYSYTYYKLEDIKFNYYPAEKQSDGSYKKTSETPLAGNPVNAGGYIVEAVFAETDGIQGTISRFGFTINPADVYNGDLSFRSNVFVTEVSEDRTYEIDLNDLLKGKDGIIENDTFEVNADKSGISSQSNFYKEGILEDGKLKITLNSKLADYKVPANSDVATINVNIKSTNYKWLPVVITLRTVEKEQRKLNVTMDGWTYGDDTTTKVPVYILSENPKLTTVTYAKKDGTKLDTKPTDAGEYTVTVKAEYDDYVYIGTADFTIARKSIEGATVMLEKDSLEYNGEEQLPVVASVVLGGVKLTSGTDYGSECEQKIDVGTYTLKVVANDGNYTGEITVDWSITAKDMTNADAAVAGGSTYTGESVEPEITIKDGSKVLAKGTDYDVAYSNNTNAGTANADITFKGNYSGNIKKTFEIARKPVTATLEVTGTYTYTGSAIVPTVVVKENIPKNEYTLSYENNTNAGAGKVIVVDGEGGNYTVSGETSFTINKAKVVIKALDKSIRKGNAAPDLSNPVAGTDYEVTGLIGDDALGGTVSLRYSDDLNTGAVGTAEIIPSVVNINPNYEAVYEKGTLQIRKRPSSSDDSDSTGSNPVETPSTDNDKVDSSEDGTKKEDGAKQEDGIKQTVVKMQIDSKNLSVNGVVYEKDAAPVIRNDRTLVPIRFITESLGGKVEWNGITKTVTLTIDGKEIKMTIGKTLEKYGVAPVIIDGRTFVPVRFVADELGATVAWDDATKTVTITK